MELLLLEPVFKQMIWGGSRLKDDLVMTFREIIQESAGQSVLIHTETVHLRIPSIRERH